MILLSALRMRFVIRVNYILLSFIRRPFIYDRPSFSIRVSSVANDVEFYFNVFFPFQHYFYFVVFVSGTNMRKIRDKIVWIFSRLIIAEMCRMSYTNDVKNTSQIFCFWCSFIRCDPILCFYHTRIDGKVYAN